MIYEKDLDESIARYQGETNPNINTCIKLAACYALKHELFGEPEQLPEPAPAYPQSAYAYAAGPADPVETSIEYISDTEFSKAIDGKPAADIWPIMDELMSTLYVLMPRLYNGVMRKLQQ